MIDPLTYLILAAGIVLCLLLASMKGEEPPRFGIAAMVFTTFGLAVVCLLDATEARTGNDEAVITVLYSLSAATFSAATVIGLRWLLPNRSHTD